MGARSRSPSYQKVSQEEVSEVEEKKKLAQGKRAEQISTKIHAVLWILAAAALIYFLDVFGVMVRDPRVHR